MEFREYRGILRGVFQPGRIREFNQSSSGVMEYQGILQMGHCTGVLPECILKKNHAH